MGATVDQMMDLYEMGNNWDGAEEDEKAKEIFDHSTAEDYNKFIKSVLENRPYIFIASDKSTIEKLENSKKLQEEND